jgi:hypothetical protein
MLKIPNSQLQIAGRTRGVTVVRSDGVDKIGPVIVKLLHRGYLGGLFSRLKGSKTRFGGVDSQRSMRNITLGLSREVARSGCPPGWDFFFYALVVRRGVARMLGSALLSTQHS